MKELAVQIVRCDDNRNFPGWIECEFKDADGRRHLLIDKVPLFSMDPSLDPLDDNCEFPQPAGVECEILDIWRDPLGRELVRITIDRPWHVESTEKLSEFVVLAAQLSDK